MSDSELICSSPSLLSSPLNTSSLSATAPLSLPYGLILDRVVTLRDLSALTSSLFDIYPDPQFEPFDDEVKTFFSQRNEYLTINVCS